MDKGSKIVLILLIILTVGIVSYCIYSVINRDLEETDAEKFRVEYMSLNDQENESTGKTYIDVIISENNTIKYLTTKEAAEFLEGGSGIIYFGFPTCPWCRNLVPILTSVGEDLDETIYYVNIYDIRSSFEVKDGSLEKIKDGTEDYYKILSLMDEVLDNYSLQDEDGNIYDTGEKRLYAPTLVAVKNGNITGIHVGTVESQTDAYESLSTKQTEELKTIIKELIYTTKDNEVCTPDMVC